MVAYNPLKKQGTNDFKASGDRRKKMKGPADKKASAGYKAPKATSNTAEMSRLSPSPNKLNAKGAKGKMTKTKRGSGKPMTKKTVKGAKATMKLPDLR